jgi:phosphatidylserine decarboxylase
VIHKEGYTIIIVTLVILVGLNLLLGPRVPQVVSVILKLASVIFFGLVVQFFRNPSRQTPVDVNHIIAPADGKVVVIEEVEETEYLKRKCQQISIFMSPLNVHVNRNPIGGEVVYDKYHPGKYLVAWHPKASELNERTTVVIKDEKGREILFRQIAGAVARRIRYYVHEGDTVEQGEEMGFIKFGSRVDVFIPLESKVKVNIDDKTVGGETVLAEF